MPVIKIENLDSFIKEVGQRIQNGCDDLRDLGVYALCEKEVTFKCIVARDINAISTTQAQASPQKTVTATDSASVDTTEDAASTDSQSTTRGAKTSTETFTAAVATTQSTESGENVTSTVNEYEF